MSRELGEDAIDRPAAVRSGEELDVGHLAPYLEDSLGLEGEVVVRQFPSGYSNLTYLLRVGDHELVLRRPPFGSKPKTGHDMHREHMVLSALRSSFPYCPEPLLFCDDPSVIGSPFYVMRRIEGIIVRRDFPPELSLSPAEVRAVFERLIDVHVELHSVDFREVGLDGFGKPEGYVERQVRDQPEAQETGHQGQDQKHNSPTQHGKDSLKCKGPLYLDRGAARTTRPALVRFR